MTLLRSMWELIIDILNWLLFRVNDLVLVLQLQIFYVWESLYKNYLPLLPQMQHWLYHKPWFDSRLSPVFKQNWIQATQIVCDLYKATPLPIHDWKVPFESNAGCCIHWRLGSTLWSTVLPLQWRIFTVYNDWVTQLVYIMRKFASEGVLRTWKWIWILTV